MEISIGNNIRILHPTADLRRWAMCHLEIDNPDFYKKQQMGKSTYNTPRTLCLYERAGDEIKIPFGCLRDIWGFIKDSPYSVKFQPIRRLDYHSDINLYPYQDTAVNKALKAKNGILVMPCGSGKTQSGLEIIARLGGRALWLTHTQDLLNQSKARAEAVLECGTGAITAGRVNLGTHITFATVQTMAKISLADYRDYWDIIIVDECQHCAGTPTRVTQFYKVVSQLSARYKIGLTATPKRADGLEKAMFALLGGVIHEVSRDEVKHTTCPIKVQQIETGWHPNYNLVLMGDGTIDYAKIVDNMIHDDERYNVVMGKIATLDGATIVLANRVEYLQRLCENTGYGKRCVCLSGMGQSKKAKAERKEALRRLNAGEIDCIFASYKLAAEGLDCPNLKYLVMATPEKDSTIVQQSAGRVGRKANNKDHGTVIDFVDDFGMYRKWSKERDIIYKRLGYDILE